MDVCTCKHGGRTRSRAHYFRAVAVLSEIRLCASQFSNLTGHLHGSSVIPPRAPLHSVTFSLLISKCAAKNIHIGLSSRSTLRALPRPPSSTRTLPRPYNTMRVTRQPPSGTPTRCQLHLSHDYAHALEGSTTLGYYWRRSSSLQDVWNSCKTS